LSLPVRVKETGPLNIPMRLPIPIGMPTLGPALATQGGPMTYVSPKTGRQYVVITAGGARQSPKRGD